MSGFIREDRYLVIKRKDIENHLTKTERILLYRLANKIRQHAPPNKEIQYVVVESGWPEFEAVWKMIEDRVETEENKNAKFLKGDDSEEHF